MPRRKHAYIGQPIAEHYLSPEHDLLAGGLCQLEGAELAAMHSVCGPSRIVIGAMPSEPIVDQGRLISGISIDRSNAAT